jgi:ADP-heptose:LPS heptosyltransferase
LGDIVHSLPVLTALRRRFPLAHITWIVNRAYESLLRDHPDLDETMPFDRAAPLSGWWSAGLGFARFLMELRRKRFDLVVDLQGLFRSGLMAAATGAARRVGLSTAREGAVWCYTDVIPVADFNGIHAVDRYWLVAEALGAGEGPIRFHVPVTEETRQWAREALHGCPRPWLVLGVGSRWLTKRWPPVYFAALARQAQERFGGTAVFIGAADEVALSAATAARLTGPARDLTGRTSLPRLAAVLAEADLMLANDTGPLHLAAALGRPVVAPYTCTKARLNGPYSAEASGIASAPQKASGVASAPRVRGAVESTVWCQGSYLKRCPRMECMAELTPERLWPLLQEVLLSWEKRPRSA